MKLIKALSTSALAVILLITAGCKLTEENYKKLEMGMEMSQIEDLIGTADSCDELLGAQSCVWGDESTHIKVKLMAGKAVFFSKKGLK